MTKDDTRRINEIVRLWPPEDRAWWRELLEIAPDEALKIAPLVLMNAYPARPEDAL